MLYVNDLSWASYIKSEFDSSVNVASMSALLVNSNTDNLAEGDAYFSVSSVDESYDVFIETLCANLDLEYDENNDLIIPKDASKLSNNISQIQIINYVVFDVYIIDGETYLSPKSRKGYLAVSSDYSLVADDNGEYITSNSPNYIPVENAPDGISGVAILVEMTITTNFFLTKNVSVSKSLTTGMDTTIINN